MSLELHKVLPKCSFYKILCCSTVAKSSTRLHLHGSMRLEFKQVARFGKAAQDGICLETLLVGRYKHVAVKVFRLC